MAVRADGAWTLRGQQGHEYGPFAGVIVTCPAPQTADLLANASPQLARACATVEMLPCWATMVAFESPLGLGDLVDPVSRVGVAGDWSWGDRLEGAFMSGLQMAEELAGLFGEAGSPAV